MYCPLRGMSVGEVAGRVVGETDTGADANPVLDAVPEKSPVNRAVAEPVAEIVV